MKWTIDRFEGDFAVVETENRQMADIPRAALPPDVKEGDVVVLQIGREETERKKSEISERFKSLLKDGREK